MIIIGLFKLYKIFCIEREEKNRNIHIFEEIYVIVIVLLKNSLTKINNPYLSININYLNFYIYYYKLITLINITGRYIKFTYYNVCKLYDKKFPFF